MIELFYMVLIFCLGIYIGGFIERNERSEKLREYAVYKGEDLIAMGTAEECAAKMGVSKEYIEWLTMPTAKRRLAARKRPERCTTAIRLDED